MWPYIIVLEVIMATREKGRKKIKPEAPQEASRQFRVTDPISMADLENIHTRRGKYPSQSLPSDQRLGKWPKRKRRKECLERKWEDP